MLWNLAENIMFQWADCVVRFLVYVPEGFKMQYLDTWY